MAESPDEVRRWHILSGNSLYLFLHDEKKEVHVVPLEQVLSVRHLPAEKTKPDAAQETAPKKAQETAPAAGPTAADGNGKAGQ
ncbi:MAG: hypothetical protein ACOY3E_02795 [Pseudomonadota bacterium]